MRAPARYAIPFTAASAALIVALAACQHGNDATAPPPPSGGGSCGSAADLATCLPTWQTFSPKQASEDPTPSGTPSTSETTHELDRVDSTGKTISLGNITFVCTDSSFNFVDNPDKALTFNLDQTKIWPGSLIQGKTHRDGKSISDLQELTIRERAPLTVTMTFNDQDNTRVIDKPDAGTVNQAIGSMIGNAQAESLATATNIDYHSESYSSEEQAALAFGASGRYLGFEGSAKGSISRSATRSVVVAKFVQQMYIAGVVQPESPAAAFSSDFTPSVYKQFADQGQIGPDNPPLIVSRIGFGRMMVFSMSANAEAKDIEGALSAAYNGIGSGAALHLSAKDSAILQDAEIRITQVGGDQNNALAAIHSGHLADYFTNTAPLTSAAPLWFELKTLTGETALVSEPGTYTQTTCVPKVPGTFDFRPEQVLNIPFTAGTQRQTVEADVNGDGRMDLVFNERRTAPAMNRVHVALANADGTFTLKDPVDNPNTPPEGWENYNLLVADIDGDGRADLLWNTLGYNNVVYSAMTSGDGTFVWRDRQEHLNHGWGGGYVATTGDLNGDGRTDILWSNPGSNPTILRTFFGLAQPDSTFSMISNYVDHAGNYSGYSAPVMANFDGTNGDDFVVNASSASYNNSHVGLFTPTSATTGTLAYPSPLVYGGTGWDQYTMGVGDVDGQRGADLVFVKEGRIFRALSNGDGTFDAQSVELAGLKTGPVEPFMADFNNDGRADLLEMHREAGLNQLTVGFGIPDGTFTFPDSVQAHPKTPAVGWLPFEVFVGDVNGDGKPDIVWVDPSSAAEIYVALAK